MYLQLNTRFNPFTYDEMVKPLLYYKQAYDATEAAYSDLATRAEQWKAIAESDDSPMAKAMYQNYSNDLSSVVSDFSTGMTASNRSALLDMRRRYSREIQPIEIAFKRRAQLDDEQRKVMASDPTMLYQRRANEMSLDDFIKNPSLDYGQGYSGAMLTKQVAQAASGMAKEARDSAEGRRKLRALLPYQYELIQQNGFSRDAVMKAIMNSPDADRILTGLVDNAVSSSGVLDWGDKDTISRAYDYARQGLWSAIGDTKSQVITDSYNMQNALSAAREARAREDARQNNLNRLVINPLNIYSSRKLSQEEKTFNKNVEDFSKYFYKDIEGRVKMTKEGWDEYNRNVTQPISTVGGFGTSALMNVESKMQGADKKFTPTNFRKFMDSIGAKNVNGWQPDNLGNMWNRYISESLDARTSKYDATRVTEYDYTIAGAQQGDIKDAIMTANRGLALKEVDYDDESKQFKDTGEEITMEDLKNEKYKVTSTRFSPYGTTVMIQDDKGNVRRFRMPAGINTTNENNRDRATTAAYQWQQVVNTGQYTDEKGNIRQASPEEIAYAQQQYEQSIQEAYLYHSQLGVQNKVKEQEFNPYSY